MSETTGAGYTGPLAATFHAQIPCWCGKSHPIELKHRPDPGTAVPPRPAAPDATAGDGLREALAEESARHRSLMERAPHGPFELRCTCGWDGGRYDHGWGADGTHAAWRQHLADAVLALPALRDVLAAAARDAEKVRRVSASLDDLAESRDPADRMIVRLLRRALDPS